MRAKGATVQQILLALALLAGLCWNLAQAAELRAVELRSGATGTRAELRLDQQAEYRLISLSGPDRLVVDLPGVRQDATVKLPAASGLVRAVRSGHPQPGVLRVVFDLAAPVVALAPHFEPGADGPRLVLEWPGDGAHDAPVAAVAPVTAPATAQSTAPADPAAASNAATSRLIATLPAAGEAKPPASQTVAPVSAAATDPARILAGQPVAPAPAQTAPSTPAVAGQPPVKTVQDIARRAGMRPLIIAIDAGHGGQDPGARGANGSREKDITLKIARELARQVNATPGLKAYLTRDTDVFIPLAQRYQKARAAKADLFVSIHADSFTSPTARGSSVFVLSQRGASSQAARWLASQENAADLVGGVKLQDKDDTLASVLLDLSQSATMKASEDMASAVLDGLKRLGKTHKDEVERANFVVLRSPDVPSMLVETAFISNPEEERRLNDPKHQADLARAILDGVTGYFSRQPPPGTLYAARAEAAASAAGSQ
ncbi:MAG TPA: N-acetylmuramoyl-L-alanine amidase [Xanthomonadaceae bacterium]|nr:N-acetylmuramoyl-L-alanine amidase [Xanthomonadaceae bacterium]